MVRVFGLVFDCLQLDIGQIWLFGFGCREGIRITLKFLQALKGWDPSRGSRGRWAWRGCGTERKGRGRAKRLRENAVMTTEKIAENNRQTWPKWLESSPFFLES